MANKIEIIESTNRKYEILKTKEGIIGTGSFGQIFKCRESNSNEWNLYVKIIEKRNPKLIKSELDISQLLQEQDCVNLLRPKACIEQESKIFILMEICDYDLAKEFQILQNQKLWYKEEDILDIIQQLLNGLYTLNTINIIHRDIKPENILVKRVGNEKNYKISDFGISKILEDIQTEQKQTQAGTRTFWSPQMFKGKYSAKCDVFSLGILFYQLMRKVHPQQIEGQELFFKELQNFYEELKIKKFQCKFPDYKRYGTLFEQLLCSMIVYTEEERKSLIEVIDLLIIHDVEIILQIILNKNQVLNLILQKASQQGLLETVDSKIIEYNILLLQLELLKIGLALIHGIISNIPKKLFKNFPFIQVIEVTRFLAKDPKFQPYKEKIKKNFFFTRERANQINDDIQQRVIWKQDGCILTRHFNDLKQTQVKKGIKDQISEYLLLKSLFENNQAMNLNELVSIIISLEEKFPILNYLHIDPEEILQSFQIK